MKKTTRLGGAYGLAGLQHRAGSDRSTSRLACSATCRRLYADIGGPGSVAAAKLAVADFTKDNPNVKVELDQRRPPEQAGHRHQRRQPVVRRRQGRHDRRHAELGRRARGQPGRRNKNKAVRRLRRGGVDLTGPKCYAEHRPLDLRHLDAGERHRQGDGQDRRRHLVLPHRRLCFRSRARARYRRPSSKATAARCSARFVTRSTPATSRRSCCRRSRPRPRSSVSPMRAATPSTRSSRRPSSASSRAARGSPAFWCSPATSTRSACRPRRACR